MPIISSVPPLEYGVTQADIGEHNNNDIEIVNYSGNWGDEDMRMGLD
jgi:hypothetical protein